MAPKSSDGYSEHKSYGMVSEGIHQVFLKVCWQNFDLLYWQKSFLEMRGVFLHQRDSFLEK